VREFGDSEHMVAQTRRDAWDMPLDALESETARWIRIIEGRRRRQQAADGGL
jgi:hypothetical protein